MDRRESGKRFIREYSMNKRSLAVMMLMAGIILVSLVGANAQPQSRGSKTNSDLYKKLNSLQEIISLVNENYVDPVEWDEVMQGAFDGLLESLDPHSNYIPKEQFESMNEQFVGKFQGIGIEFDVIDDWITVIAPVAGSPSETVGLRPGDKIVRINGESAYKFSRTQVMKSLRGEKGTSVMVTLRRPGLEADFDVTIVRDDIPIYSVLAAFMIDEKTGYLLVSRFSSTTADEVEEALDKLEAQGMTQLLLDLRNNGGGYMEQAVEILDKFIGTTDTLVFTRGRQPSMNQVHMSRPRGTHPNYPIIALINRGSPSASEIVAGALQDLDRGLGVGETSFGKGLVQRQWRLSDGSALRVTVGRYYTPSGRTIQRPYESGSLQYYRDLYGRSDDQATIDSIKATLPKYKTRSGRTVYGGGGIFPDVPISLNIDLSDAAIALINRTDRLFFRYAETLSSDLVGRYSDVEEFIKRYKLGADDRDKMIRWIEAQGETVDHDTFASDWAYVENQVARQVAGLLWDREALYRVWLEKDNQAQEAIGLFGQARSLAGI